jgi:ribosome hibernation promoting factor
VELVLKGRGTRITDQLRRSAERKLDKLTRRDPRIVRCELEVIQEGSPRVDGGHRVQAACELPRHTFRAEGTGKDVEAALDQVVEHLERQLVAHRGRLQAKRSPRITRTSSTGADRTE